eukprot:CAMPEP_0175970078 /NCGR_PEP_ID=MMETSP0108-20121206/40838_1 /TAXON_ID=195067 ORGANISM="Goniomonas pacifica, Strain CCMP1869" /NCGR_SAMPLE_ID=MMETSP0108 /ASSEMBLY_ACC=CAM_ASM_000204 /LENGTH=81 /DNA_ID=CAMNT_0017298973 /DNA_START=16 /DNA_END=258 /DNA_ORIENTATION=-
MTVAPALFAPHAVPAALPEALLRRTLLSLPGVEAVQGGKEAATALVSLMAQSAEPHNADVVARVSELLPRRLSQLLRDAKV